jgi:hypothetical protein
VASLTPTQRATLARELGVEARPFTLRAFAEHPDFCGLDYSPLVAGIADASEGLQPTTLTDAQSERHFGCPLSRLPRTRARTVVVRAGGRGGKTSRLLAPKALHAAWTVPVPLLGKGEEAYSILVAPSMRLAQQAFSFCRGYVEASPVLSRALVDGPTKEHLTLRRPDGVRVRIEVFAAGRGGAQLRAKSLVSALFDEAAFFRDEGTGVVNDAELYRAVLQRIVPGGQAWLVTTPWLEGVGLVEETIAKDFGAHVHALCAVAPTRALNPFWDPTGEIEADLRAQDPDAAAREIDAVPMAGGSRAFFDANAITHAVDERRPLSLEPARGGVYGAGGDFAFKRNSSALCVVERRGDDYHLALLEEERPEPGTPLKPSAVCGRFGAELKRFSVGAVAADSHERDAVATELAAHNVSVVPAPEGQAGKAESYLFARRLLQEGRLHLPDHARLKRQLRDVISKPAPGGGLSISSPSKASGEHGDLVSALVVALWQAQRGGDDSEIDGAVSARPVSRRR